MLGHSFAYSAAPIRQVKEVQFGILSPEEIVSITPCHPTSFASVLTRHRKLIRSPRLRIRSYGRRALTSRKLEGSWIHGWVPLIATSNARRAVRGCRSVLVISATSSLPDPSSTLVCPSVHRGCALPLIVFSPPKGFIVKVKKILESICVNCGKLKADLVSRRYLCSRLVFAPHLSKFSGGSLLMGNPKPALFNIKVVVTLPRGGVRRASSVA
jgi:DNA-directed RNA polymerase II subunit RPB1